MSASATSVELSPNASDLSVFRLCQQAGKQSGVLWTVTTSKEEVIRRLTGCRFAPSVSLLTHFFLFSSECTEAAKSALNVMP